MKMTHPGTITYVDADSKTEKVIPIAEVPQDLQFARNTKGELVPVVRVVARVAGNQRFLRELGPRDEFLRETVQRSS
jgi:hypothetical protein